MDKRKIYKMFDSPAFHQENRKTDIIYRAGFIYTRLQHLENQKILEKYPNKNYYSPAELTKKQRYIEYIPIDDLINEVHKCFLWSYDEIMESACSLCATTLITAICKPDEKGEPYGEIIGFESTRSTNIY